MKPTWTWKPRKKNAGRSFGTAQDVSPHTELLRQVCRVRSAIV